jgi:hypothetical protein
MQGLGKLDELFVLNNGVGVLLHTQHLAIVATGDGLIALDGLASGVEDGSGEHLPISLANGESFAGREGSVYHVTKTVPSGLAVKESAGGELMSHGFEEKGAGSSRLI